MNGELLSGARTPDLRKLARSIGIDGETMQRAALIDRIENEIRIRRADDAQRYGAERASWARTAAARRAELTRPGQMTTMIGALGAAKG